MSNAPQAQKPQAQNTPSSNQNQGKTPQTGNQAGNNVKKDESTAQSGKTAMKNEGGSGSTSGNKSSNV